MFITFFEDLFGIFVSMIYLCPRIDDECGMNRYQIVSNRI